MINLIGLSKEELAAEVVRFGEKAFRAKQLWHFMYHQGAKDFSLMTTLAKPVRDKMATAYTLERPKIVTAAKSKDKTQKWLIEMNDGNTVECVYIPEEDRGAVCISSQVGCPLACEFCLTGKQKFTRDLTPYEIVTQFMIARDTCKEWPSPNYEGRMLSNIVLMGMGEPLLNFANVKQAIDILSDGDGIGISRRRITLSTAGIVPLIPKVAEELKVKLAVSLHAATDEVRGRLMPINRKYPLKELMQACREYQRIGGSRSYITFEYAMIKGVNDSAKDAKALLSLIKGIRTKFNLIPYNETEGAPFKCSKPETIKKFSDILQNAGYAAPVRVSRGQDISAACGQLKSLALKDQK